MRTVKISNDRYNQLLYQYFWMAFGLKQYPVCLYVCQQDNKPFHMTNITRDYPHLICRYVEDGIEVKWPECKK